MILSISEHIYKALSGNSALKAVVNGRIYPIATKSEVSFPFIVYSRDSIDVRYDKLQHRCAEVEVSVYAAAETYAQSVTLAELVASILDKKSATYTGFSVTDAQIVAAVENYYNQTYIQQITFRFFVTENDTN